MFNLYILEDWYGTPHIMSSSKIHKRVMDDSSKSNYNWIASATDLINVCNKRNFPEEKANDIKVAILNCYSSLMWSEDDYSRRKKTDLNAVYFAYNSLYGVEDQKVIQARTRFLKSFLSLVTHSSFLFMAHHGENYRNAEKEWINHIFSNLFVQEQIDFASLFSLLKNDFTQRIKQLEESGLFAEEDKIEQERLIGYIDETVNQFFEHPERQKVLAKVPPKKK